MAEWCSSRPIAKNLVKVQIASIAALALVAASATPTRAAAQTYRVDPDKSRATIHVGKAGAFSFIAGHTHEVIGPIQNGSVDVDLDAPSNARVRLDIASSELKVSPAGEPQGDAPKVQDVMESEQVLDVAHHPRITYESSAVTLKTRHDNVLDYVVTGQLTIRGVAQSVVAPVRVEVNAGALTATGRLTIKQTSFGIKPVSVAGVVAVKDALAIDFSIVASRQ